ncbi:MAG: formylglycine-generating enzyme family protein [Magnetococcales bacterium]|nr:formylglycine-generating enzyme family protein [Magnetococcales bacterium]
MRPSYKLLLILLLMLALPNLGYFSMLLVAVPDLSLFRSGKQVATQTNQEIPAIRDANGMEFILIPAGRFLMGTPFAADVSEDEMPQHEVIISRPFYLGRYEVKQAEWEAVMRSNPSEFKGADRPVESVSWEEVREFIGKLNERAATDLYRLPSEAEWEYAARAGTTTSRYWGDGNEALEQHAWFAGNAGKRSRPVGQLQANPWGLYDMLGNVWEWCQDWYSPKSYSNGTVTDPRGPSDGASRVLRGGGWNNYASHIRAAYRFELNPAHRRRNLGLRLVMEAR